MNEKKYKILIGLMVSLLLISVTLFVIDKFVLAGDNNGIVINPVTEETITIYRAVVDIKPHSLLTRDSFEAKTIVKPNDSANYGFITNLDTILGQYSQVYIVSGTFLTESMMTSENPELGSDYSIELRSDYGGRYYYGDKVDVYAVSEDNGNVIPLFSNKTLYTQDGKTQSTQTLSKIYINVSQNELMTYYSLFGSYKILVTRIDPALVNPINNGNQDNGTGE